MLAKSGMMGVIVVCWISTSSVRGWSLYTVVVVGNWYEGVCSG